MISKEDIENCIIDMTIEQDYLDLDNDKIEQLASVIYQRIAENDTFLFSLPTTDTIMTHNITDREIKKAINSIINTSKFSMGAFSPKEFEDAKKDYFVSKFINKADTPIHLYNLFKNLNSLYKTELFSSIFETAYFDTIYNNTTFLEKLNKTLEDKGILTSEKDSTFFKNLKNKLPNIFLLWISIFFVENKEYLTKQLILKLIEKVNIRNYDLSYFYEVFDELENIEDDIDELTDEEVELLL